MRIAAGEAIALIYEMGNLEKFCGSCSKGISDDSVNGEVSSRNVNHIHGLKAKVMNQVRNLSAEAGGKGSAKKDLNNQRYTFRDVLEFLEVLLFPFLKESMFFFKLFYKWLAC